VYEVPLLFESGAHRRVDTIIVVTANRAAQITAQTPWHGENGSRRIEPERWLKGVARMSCWTAPETKLW
jgi:hypothetical protein